MRREQIAGEYHEHRAYAHGWFRTNPAAASTPTALFVEGRLDDVIVRGSEKRRDVEDVLSTPAGFLRLTRPGELWHLDMDLGVERAARLGLPARNGGLLHPRDPGLVARAALP